MTTLLAGATGLVGGHILSGLLANGETIVSVSRRSTGLLNPLLTEIIADFASLPALPKAKTAICALGTTMALAGSKAAFRAVDHDAVIAFFASAQKAGATNAIVLTAIGSDPSATAFYSRVKGEVERAISDLSFARLDIVRPGLIIGPRTERRPMEAVMQSIAPLFNPLLFGSLEQFGAINAETIALAIVALAGRSQPGRYVHNNRQLRNIAAFRP